MSGFLNALFDPLGNTKGSPLDLSGMSGMHILGALGIGGDSAAAKANSAAAQQAYQDQITKAEEEIRAETNLTEQEKANRVSEGQQRLAEGSSGFDVSSGSPLDAQFAQFAADQFKDQVAVFNGLVNVGADQAAAINATNQGAAVAQGAQAQAMGSDVSIASAIFAML